MNTTEQEKKAQKRRPYINQYVKDENGQYVGTLAARKQNNGKILVTYSVLHDNDHFAKRQGTFIALQKTEWKMPDTKKPDLKVKLEIIKTWVPKFMEHVEKYFGVPVPSPV